MTTKRLDNIEACVFDAYGTLFDVNAAAAHCAEELGDTWQALANTWRLKQLQYTWLRSLMQRHTDFWQVTGDALDYAMDTHGVDDADLRKRLMDLYLTLDAYEEVAATLATLKAAGLKTAILSNGSPGDAQGRGRQRRHQRQPRCDHIGRGHQDFQAASVGLPNGGR